MTVTASEVAPLWTAEGPQFYDQALEYHRPWAKPGTPFYNTILSGGDEADFEDWVDQYDVPFDYTANITDYDMRGYWVARVKGSTVGYTIGEHFPDIWKTPYDTTFSAESLYARDGCPYHWHGDKLINDADGTLIFWADYKPTQSDTAVDVIQASKVDPRSQTKGAMGDDLDLRNFSLYLSQKLRLKAMDQVMDAQISRTIAGASTIQFTLDDDDRSILRSGLLSDSLDIKVDGLWFRLCQVGKQGDDLVLTFETREIAILRLYNTKKIVSSAHTTRAQFILSLIRELPLHIPVVIPELNILQTGAQGTSPVPATTPQLDNNGIPTDLPASNDPIDTIFDPRRNLTVKGERATPEQISNVNTILGVGAQLGARRKVMVASIMTAIDESSIINLAGGDEDSAGAFQQRPSQGWGTYEQVTNLPYAAHTFFTRAIAYDRENPNISYNDLCQGVQHSGTPTAYGQYQPEAENFVTAYTLTNPSLPLIPTLVQGVISSVDSYMGGGSRPITPTTGMDGYFYRGIPGQNNADWGLEDSWTCIQRLASEVNWYAFFVGGTFWYISGAALFSIKPIMNITESSKGIAGLDFDYDRGKKSGTVQLSCRVGRWLAQPGAVVQLQNMGPVNGRWLVQEFERSLFDLDASITLIKPMPALQKADTGDTTIPAGSAAPAPGGVTGTIPPPTSVVTPDSIMIPAVAPATHCTDGVSGYPAVDWAINQNGEQIAGTGRLGSPIYMQEGGVVSDVHLIPWHSGYGGITFYFKSNSGEYYFVTHMDESSPVREGPIAPSTLIGYTTKNPINATMINGAHVHVGCTGYTGLSCGTRNS
jgi:hypothetical protein